ncbi:hypothetical protein IPL85_03215 [Candidatus Saccharibacteria bacterium]|nr:MAG: hypothetical protein IPL85_03215 [Candidatus Saccharibacteria bacterium]
MQNNGITVRELPLSEVLRGPDDLLRTAGRMTMDTIGVYGKLAELGVAGTSR